MEGLGMRENESPDDKLVWYDFPHIPFEQRLFFVSTHGGELLNERICLDIGVHHLHFDQTQDRTVYYRFSTHGVVRTCQDLEGTHPAIKVYDGWGQGLAAALLALMESVETASDLLQRPKRRAIARMATIKLVSPFLLHPPHPDTPT
jgi:hypothetical protein